MNSKLRATIKEFPKFQAIYTCKMQTNMKQVSFAKTHRHKEMIRTLNNKIK